jgi:16S rRNA (cytosine967-C5)-methyltransferase
LFDHIFTKPLTAPWVIYPQKRNANKHKNTAYPKKIIPLSVGDKMTHDKFSPRFAAAALLTAVTDRGWTLDHAMSASSSFKALDGRDRAFARAITSAALRRMGGIDRVLDAYLQRPIAEMAANARAVLRTGAAQSLALKGPAHAVVSETVAVAKIAAPAFNSLINAVLRKVASDPDALDAQPPGADLPDWLFARWRASYGAQADAIALALRHEPPQDLSVKEDPTGWAQRLNGVAFADRTVRLPAGASVSDLDGFADGGWWVQDAAAASVVRLAGDVKGLSVLDMCAAPGGKTMQLAAAGAQVTALDQDEVRLVRVRENLARTRLSADVAKADARTWRSDARFDLVLLDAPCTATGTLRRHPDVAWLRRPSDIESLARLQAELLDAAFAHLKPTGRVLYAVCSLESEEGEGAIAALGARRPLEIIDMLRTTPATRADTGGMDGFYAAMLSPRE